MCLFENVFLCMLVSNSKIDKLRANCDIEWPDKIHEACLAANTHFKKSTEINSLQVDVWTGLQSCLFVSCKK